MPTASAIAKTAWFVLCLISCFAISTIWLFSSYYLYIYLTVSQHFKCPTLSWRDFCLVVITLQIHLLFCILQVFQPPFTGKPRPSWGLSYKVFWRSFFTTQTVWVKNKLCLLKTRQRRPKNRNVCFSFQPTHISGSIWISTQLDFNNIRLLLGGHASPSCN